jgi:hypothetical protein
LTEHGAILASNPPTRTWEIVLVEDGSTAPAGGARPGPTDAPLNNRRQAAVILLTMFVFLGALVLLAWWAAGNG